MATKVDEFLKQNPTYMGNANIENRTVAPTPTTKKTVGGIKGLLAGFLPTVGGAIGAVGGSLVAPFAGTVAGGASGAALGEYLRQRLTGEDQDGIDKGNLVEQGAFGALGALGKARALSSAAKASKAMTAVNSVDDVANVASATKRIPVKFLEEAAMSTPGKATTDVTNKLLINPTVGELADASKNKGVFGELRRFRSAGANSAESVPYAKLTQKTTNVPVSTATKYSEAIQDIPSYKTPVKPTAIDAYGVPLPETTSYVPKSNAMQKAGQELQQSVINPKVRAGISGAQKEAEIAGELKNVKGLSAKSKYKNLQTSMDEITGQISPILEKSKGTAKTSDLLTSIRNNAEQSGHFLAGDPTYEKQLSAVLTDLGAKTGGAQKLTAKQIFNYKKGMDMSSVFTKLEKGADLNPKEASRLAVWSSLDDSITSAEPAVKALTKRQSLLMEGATGLQKSAEKTAGIPILGVKSQKVEQGIQGVKTLTGKTLEKIGGITTSGVPQSATSFKPFAGQVARQTVSQALPRMFAAPFMSQPTQEDASSTLEQDIASLNDPTTNVTTPQPETQQSPFNRSNIEQAIIQDLQTTGGKNVATLSKLYEMFGQTPEPKALNSTSAQTVSDIESGLANIQALGAEYSQSNVNNPIIGKIRGLNPFDTSAQTLQADTARVKQVIGKALEGGVLRKEDEIKYAKILPTISDTEETAQYKISAITEDLRRKLALYKNNLGVGGGGTDIADLTAQ